MKKDFVTNVEQSKLVSKYVPEKSSDLSYYCQEGLSSNGWELQLISVEEAEKIFEENLGTKWRMLWKIIPAWSITSLLKLIPRSSLEINDFGRWRCKAILGEETIVGAYKESAIEAVIDTIQSFYITEES